MTTIGLGAQWGGPAEDKGITIAPGRGWVGDPGIVLGGNPSPAAAAAGRLGFSPQPGIEQQIAAILGELEVAVAMAAADPSPENQAAVADLAQAYSNATSLALDISPDPGASDDQGVTVGPLGGMSLSDIAQAIEGGIQAADPEGLGRMIGGADFYSGGDEGFGGRQNLGGPTAEEGTSPVEGNAFAATGDDVTSGWGGAGSAFDGANASMSASDFSNAVLDGIMAGGMGFGDIIGGGREMGIGSGFANLGSLGTNAFDGATPSGPAFGGFGDVAENEAGREGGFARGLDQASSNERSLGEISADQAARAGTIADIMSGANENAFDAVIGSENAIGPSFGGAEDGGAMGGQSFGEVAGSFGADGLSDGPGLAGSFGGGDVGVDIAGGFDSGRTGDFAQPGLGQSFGNGDDVAAAIGAENSIGPSFGGAEDGAAAASASTTAGGYGDAAETEGGFGAFDGGAMGGITGGSDITGGFGGDGFAGLGDGSGREAGIGGFGEAGTGSGFAGMSSGNAFDGGQSNNEADSSMGSSSEVSSGGSFGGGSSRGGRGSGGDDGDMSGGWGGGGWGGESDGVSGGFDNGGRGGEHGGLDGGGFGGGVGWG